MDPWVAGLDPLGVRAYPSPLTEAEVKSQCDPVKPVPAFTVLHVFPWLIHLCAFALQVSILETNRIFSLVLDTLGFKATILYSREVSILRI